METVWNLKQFFTSDADPCIDIELADARTAVQTFVNAWKGRTDFLEKSEVAREALDAYEHLMAETGTTGDVGYYVALRQCQDKANPRVKALVVKAEEQSRQLSNELRFFTLSLSKLPVERQRMFLASSDLQKYRHYLERLFLEGTYALSEAEENILALKQGPASSAWEQLTLGLLFKETVSFSDNAGVHQKTFSELLHLCDDLSPEIRMRAATSVQTLLERWAPIAEAELNALLQNKKIDDSVRSLPRADFRRHLDDDISSEVVDQLVSCVQRAYPLAHRFFRLKAQLLGVPSLSYAERNISALDISQTFTFDEALMLVQKTLGSLDVRYNTFIERYQSGFLDIFPRVGKQDGACCWHGLKRHPTFIMLNFTGQLRDVTTLAHELGHGFNNELMKTRCHALDFDTPKSTAEVASTFMEGFVLDALKEHADDRTKLSFLLTKLQDAVQTIFRQVAFYTFEQRLHERVRAEGYVSAEHIHALFREAMASYMGDAIDVSQAGPWWVYVSHFRDFFYVYSYASGLLISQALYARMREHPEQIQKVNEFLSAGTSQSPTHLFAQLGIDITLPSFWESGLQVIEHDLIEAETLVTQLIKTTHSS